MEGFIYDLNLIKGFNQASQLPLPIFNYLVLKFEIFVFFFVFLKFFFF